MESLRVLAKRARENEKQHMPFWDALMDAVKHPDRSMNSGFAFQSVYTAFFFRPLTQADYDVGEITGGYDGPAAPRNEGDYMFLHKELWCMRLIVRPKAKEHMSLDPGPRACDCFFARMSDPNADELILHVRGFGTALGMERRKVLGLFRHIVSSTVGEFANPAFEYPTQVVRATKTVAHVLFADDAELIRRVDAWAPHHPVFSTSGH